MHDVFHAQELTSKTPTRVILRKVINAEDGRYSPLLNRITGLLALLLWFSVGAAGRAIAFF